MNVKPMTLAERLKFHTDVNGIIEQALNELVAVVRPLVESEQLAVSGAASMLFNASMRLMEHAGYFEAQMREIFEIALREKMVKVVSRDVPVSPVS